MGRMPPEWRELLESILDGVPPLREALCVGHSDVSDAPGGYLDYDTRQRIASACGELAVHVGQPVVNPSARATITGATYISG